MDVYEIIADLSIPLKFGGPQPNAFCVDAAAAITLGDTREGSSVNFEQYTFVPHCNGTHTECVGHITDERIFVRDCLKDVFMRAILISTEPEEQESGDRIITAQEMEKTLSVIDLLPDDGEPAALIVRTLPNDGAKLNASYGEENLPAYFTADAMRLIVERSFKHLLCDLPSVDRMFDEGRLINHRIFWNVEEGNFKTNAETRLNSTITELIYVPNEIEDGEYLLNLQIAPFDADCSPSRPLLIAA